MTHVPPDQELPGVAEPAEATAPRQRDFGAWVVRATIVALCTLHGVAIWIGLGGWPGLTGPWPPARDDHLHYFHNAAMTPAFLLATGTTAGYDPSFMAGYPDCIFSVNSSTLPELVLLLAGPARHVVAYKFYVLASAALLPWLVAAAGLAARAGAWAIAAAVALFLVYLWSDFPIRYIQFGMLTYALSIPLALLTTSAVARYIEGGGAANWLAAAACSCLVVLVHVTTAMLIVPAAGLAYAVALVSARRSGARLPISRHLGLWGIPAAVLVVNAFWWVPGVWLASARAGSDHAFSHPEPVLGRLGLIVFGELPIQVVLVATGLVGLVALARRDRVAAAAIGGFAAAGFGWGYLAGGLRALDFLQPARHTYAFFTGASLLAGVGLSEVWSRLRRGPGRLDLWGTAAALLVGVRLFGPSLGEATHEFLGGPEPFLSSRPPARLLWLVERVREHVRPGERLLYEEGGFGLPGVPDPFRGGRYSGLLPHLVEGVELLGGPYLHAHVLSNFTQFGEGKLFGKADWGRDHFVRYARLYRPAAIACWSPRARAFCKANPDLVRILDDDGALLIGRVLGFEGGTIRGEAEVKARPGRIEVRDAVAGDDGLVVLRYHAAPHLRSDPPIEWEPVHLEDDPVPFIGFRPNGGPVTFELRPAPWSKGDR